MKWKALQIAMCPNFFSQVSSLYYLEQSCSKASHSPSSCPPDSFRPWVLSLHLQPPSHLFFLFQIPWSPRCSPVTSHVIPLTPLYWCSLCLKQYITDIHLFSTFYMSLLKCHFLSEVYPNVPLRIMSPAPLIPSTLLYSYSLTALITFNVIRNLLIMFIVSISSSKT